MRPNRLLPCIFVFAGLVRADSACPVGEPPHVAVSLSSCRSTPHAAWGIAANVADQANEYCFLPSTVVNNTVLIPRDICSDPTQFGSRENCEQLFPPLPPLPASKDADLPKDPWWATINPPGLVAGIKGLFILPPRSELEDFNFGVVRGTSRNFSAPLLGLGPSSSLLAELIDQKRISRNAWSLQLGELILGAYDQGSLGTAPLKEFSLQMPENDGRSIFGPRTCALKLLITKLEWDFLDGNGTIFNFEDAEPITACIEPNDEKFRFQSLWKNSILNSIRERSGSTSPALPSGSWIQEPGLNFLAKDFPRVGDMRITLERLNRGGEVKVTVPGTSLSRPLEGMSGGVVQPFPSTEEVMVFDGQVLDKTAVLGRVFLEQVQLLVDYEREKFWLGVSSVNKNESVPLRQNIQSFETLGKVLDTGKCGRGGNLSKGAIAGIVIGSVAGFVIVAVLLWLLKRKWWDRKKGKAEQHHHQDGDRVESGEFPD